MAIQRIRKCFSSEIPDEYKIFSGPHGRKIVAKVMKYRRRNFTLWGIAILEAVTIIMMTIEFFKVFAMLKGGGS